MVGEERLKEASDPAHPYLALIDLQVQETMLGWKKKITNLVTWGEESLVSWQKKKPSQALCISMGRAAGVGQAGVERTGLY